MRIAIITGLLGMALVASASEPLGPIPVQDVTNVVRCSPTWRLSLERRLGALEDRSERRQSAFAELGY